MPENRPVRPPHRCHGAAVAMQGVLLGMLLLASPAVAEVQLSPTAVLARGLNVAHWLRFPPSNDDAALRGYLDDAALASLKRAGFTYVRLPVGLEVVMQGRHVARDKVATVVAIVRRIQHAGLAVMIEPHPQQVGNWDFGKSDEARQALLGFWRDMAPALRPLPVGLTFPEVVNEPADDDPAAWDRLQAQVLQVIRTALPQNTVMLTGTNWSSLDGLLKVKPVADTNVIYTFHTYEPTLLTLLGVWDSGIDQAMLGAHIPFPVTPAACASAIAATRQEHTRSVMQYWCSQPQNDATIATYLQRATDWGRQHSVRVAMTEFGARGILNPPARNAYLTAMRHGAEAQHLPWALWALDDQMGFDRPVGNSVAAFRLSPDVNRALGTGRRP